jgi:hypothetical protein
MAWRIFFFFIYISQTCFFFIILFCHHRDDPAAVLTSLLRELRDLPSLGVDAYPPATLKPGHGAAVLAVLGKLAQVRF